jgi:hypothetical protein
MVIAGKSGMAGADGIAGIAGSGIEMPRCAAAPCKKAADKAAAPTMTSALIVAPRVIDGGVWPRAFGDEEQNSIAPHLSTAEAKSWGRDPT